MVVLLIMGLLAGLTLPRLKGTLGEARLRTAARDVAAVARLARDFAVFREQPVEVRFNPEKATYEVQLLDRNFEPVKERRTGRRHRDRNERELVLGDDAGGVRRLPAKVDFQAIYTAAPLTDDRDELPRIIFYGDGAASPATIVMQDDKRRRMSVEVFRTTGLTRVMAAEPAEEPKVQRRYYGPEAGRGRNTARAGEVAE